MKMVISRVCPWLLCPMLAFAGPVEAIDRHLPTEHPDPLPLSTIRADHPRLWFNGDNLPQARQRWYDPAFSNIVSKYRGRSDALSLALEGLMTEDPDKCSLAASIADGTYRPEGDKEAGHMPAIALVFDWCYNYLSPQHRSNLLSQLLSLRYASRYSSGTGVESRFHWHENFRFSSFSYIATVLAVEGEPGVYSHLRAAQNVLQNLQELGDEIRRDGAYATYYYQGTLQVLPFFLWSYATDTDFVDRSEFTQNLAAWNGYRMSPTAGGFIRGPADDDAIVPAFTRDELGAGGFYLIAQHLNDPVSQWMGDVLVNNFDQGWHWQFGEGPSFIALAHYDPGLEARPPGAAGMPRVRYFSARGQVHFRSSWGSTDDVIHGWFFNGPVGGHTGENVNHFVLWRGDDPLIMKGGNYMGTPSPYADHYYSRAIANNTLLFSPFNSATPDRDGGQVNRQNNVDLSEMLYPVSHSVVREGQGVLYSGEITDFEDEDRFSIVVGDATLAYDHDTVFAYIRDFVYLKPDLVLIRDRFSTVGIRDVRSIIHSRHRPLFSGPATVIEGNSEAGILELLDDRFVLQNGTSEAELRVLWPQNPRLRFVGGRGYEGYVDGYNSDAATECQEWLKTSPELPNRLAVIEGQWRTEIEVPPSARQIIQSVYVSELNPSGVPSLTLAEEGDDLIVTVTFPQAVGSTRVVFPRSESPRVQVIPPTLSVASETQ